MAEVVTCEVLIEFLDDYVDGRLEPGRLGVFERHLGICRECRSYLAEYRASMELARALRSAAPAGAPPASVPSELIEAVRRSLAGTARGER